MGGKQSKIAKDKNEFAPFSYSLYGRPYESPKYKNLPRTATSTVARSYSTLPKPTQLQHHAKSPKYQTRSFTYNIRCYPDITVIFRLNSAASVDAFCVHASTDISTLNDLTQNFSNHTFFHFPSGAPRRLYCYSRQSRICYIVAREIYVLLSAGVNSPETLHSKLSRALCTLHTRCIICRCTMGAAIHRLTLCSSISCLREYLAADLNIRCEDVLLQSSSISIILASVQAVAQKNNVSLLPGWPVSRLGNPGDILATVQSLPSLAYPILSSDLNQFLSGQYAAFATLKQVEVLLSWICTRFRGNVLAAYSTYILPGLDGVAQFLVADSQPEIAASFAKHDHLQPRHVLYHGTSIDRLYSVLVQGLQVLSGTPLAQHGAVYGSGIYMAREPSLALSYARANIPKTTTPIPNLKGDVSSARLLLACEHAGNDISTPSRAPPGMHIIQDPSRILIRYIFLVPSSTRVPKASELSAAILKNVKHLRDIL